MIREWIAEKRRLCESGPIRESRGIGSQQAAADAWIEAEQKRLNAVNGALPLALDALEAAVEALELTERRLFDLELARHAHAVRDEIVRIEKLVQP